MKKFDLRIAQMDLARQMESIDFLKKFIDIISDNGYNGLFLYLEDRIITKSYPFPKPHEAYTTDEIKELVAYGKKRNIELIPCVSTLGHAERFLRHQELEEFSEIRGEAKGVFDNNKKISFCPTADGLYDFLFDYIGEVASLFETELFHVGLDEFWDFAICERCKKIAPDFAGKQKLFLAHMVKMNNFLKSINKRMMMWADMFENYNSIIELVPRDVILVDWQYQYDVRFNQAHFGNLKQEYSLDLYDKLGFETIIAPASQFISNNESYIRYATDKKNVIGCLVTHWEKGAIFQDRYLPVFVWAGHLMNGELFEEAFNKMIDYCFGAIDQNLQKAIKYSCDCDVNSSYSSVPDFLLYGNNFFGLNDSVYYADECISFIMEKGREKIPKLLGKDIVNDILLGFNGKKAWHKINKLFSRGLDYGVDNALEKEIVEAINIFYESVEKSASMWNEKRPNIKPNILAEKLVSTKVELLNALEKIKSNYFVKIRFVLPDGYGYDKVTVSAWGEDCWHTLADKVFKPYDLENAIFEYSISSPVNPSKIKIEVKSLGGVGISYVDLRKGGKVIKTPQKIVNYDRVLEQVDYLLDNDSKWCYFGRQSIQDYFENSQLFDEISFVELTLS